MLGCLHEQPTAGRRYVDPDFKGYMEGYCRLVDIGQEVVLIDGQKCGHTNQLRPKKKLK